MAVWGSSVARFLGLIQPHWLPTEGSGAMLSPKPCALYRRFPKGRFSAMHRNFLHAIAQHIEIHTLR